MKRKICMLSALALMIMCCFPLTAFAEGSDEAASPSPSAAASDAASSPLLGSPADASAVIADQLHIDSGNIYAGMDKTYRDGYVPTVADGKATIVLPLIGETYNNSVNLTADLGATASSPFMFGNYSQSAGGGPYVFTMEIPLAEGRINGSYPVILTADYLNKTGSAVSQAFTVFVTITDGKKPADPNAAVTPKKETVNKPELFISSCSIAPASVGANEEFSVDITVENIGSLTAKTVRLTYAEAAGGENGSAVSSGILPAETNNSIHIENIAAGKSDSAGFKLKTTADVPEGSRPFAVTLDYSDAYGNTYTSTRQFLVSVTQPSEISYDDILISVPKTVTAGDSFALPANVYNTGKSKVKNVMITVTGAGLFPSAAAYLGDIAPGETGSGELSVLAGQLSMSEGHTEAYGKTSGIYAITYTDSAGAEQRIEVPFSTEITKPEIAEDASGSETAQPAFQWWVTVLAGFAVIAVVVAAVVVTKVMRAAKIR